MENKDLYPKTTPALAKERADLAPETMDAWRKFSDQVFKEGELSEKNQTADSSCSGTCNAMSLLHSWTYHTSLAKRSD